MEAVAPPPATSPGTNGVATAPFAAVDPSRVVDHLAVLLEAALGATRTELEAPGSLLSKTRYPDTLQRCTRFAVDTQVALYIQKDLAPTNRLENGDTDESRRPSRYSFSGYAHN
jgi:dynein heavy chain 1